MKKKYIVLLLAMTLTCLVGGCSSGSAKDTQKKTEKALEEASDQVENIVDSQDEHVLSVKNGHPNDYPDITYEEAFENFFGSPTWKYFEGENGEDVVEFTGYCTYQEVEVKARLQFILNNDGTLEHGALSFNDVPQSELITAAMIEKAFEQCLEENSGGKTSTETAENSEQENIDYESIYNNLLDSEYSEMRANTNYFLESAFYDIDKDGVPEFMVEYGTGEADMIYDVYTIDGNQAVKLGEIAGGHTGLYEYPEGNGVYTDYYHMDYEMINLVSVQDGELVEKSIFKGDAGGHDDILQTYIEMH